MYVHVQLTTCKYMYSVCTYNTYMYVCTCTTNYGMYILHANVQPFPNQKCIHGWAFHMQLLSAVYM